MPLIQSSSYRHPFFLFNGHLETIFPSTFRKRDAQDFYERASSLPHITNIRIPTLIANALNDPFLPSECFPYDIACESKFVFLETPKRGGHTGFTLAGKEENWMEVRAFEFVNGGQEQAAVAKVTDLHDTLR